jgi:hypothetical protein
MQKLPVISKKKFTPLMVASILLGLIIFNNPAAADSINPGIYALDSRPYGLDYGEWSAKWWQWLISIPQGQNPANDPSEEEIKKGNFVGGQYCGVKQNGPVWFLAGTAGGKAERVCNIPAGKAILIPLLNSFCDYATYTNYKSEPGLRGCAMSDQDDSSKLIKLEATIDGVKVKAPEKYRVQSPLTSIVFPENNLWGSPPGPTQLVSDGFWLLLEPLDPGIHKISFTGQSLRKPGLPPDPEKSDFVTSVDYTLTIR